MDFNVFFIQTLWLVLLVSYSIIVTFSTKRLYNYLIKKGVKKNVAIYYDRKIVHIFGGGVSTLFVPFVFDSPFYPLVIGTFLSLFTYLPYHKGKILYWVQTEKNMNDVKFCFMWGLIIFLLWYLLGSPWIAIIPPAMMAFGDGVTGISRNMIFKRRTKHPIGNVFMLAVCIPIGYFFAGFEGLAFWGLIAAFVATFMERYEFGPIDDNVLITVTAALVLYLGSL
ncbi:MAG: hypothetical protein KGY68_08065, partial [Candidatus Thermoplasmatota archaeon]|nr:hypothetical protein [Candidatus Thermoplasmatota archaeon]